MSNKKLKLFYSSYIAVNDYDELLMPSFSHLVSYDKQISEFFSTQFNNGSYEIKPNAAFSEHCKLSSEVSRNSTALSLRAAKSKVILTHSRVHTAMLPFSSYIYTSSIDRFCQFFREKSRGFQKHNNLKGQACFYDNFHGKLEASLDVCIDLDNTLDIKYASHLCSINENIVKPLLEKNSHLNQTNFGRFYSVSYRYGKSIHDTANILTVTTHTAVTQYASHEKILPSLKYLSDQFCTTKCGYTAHFRAFPRIYLESGRKVLKISDISFDLLFFNAISILNDISD